MIAFRIAAACCLGLELVAHSLHDTSLLPLAGSNLAQLGIVFGVTFILLEFREPISAFLVRQHRKRRQRSRRREPVDGR